MPELPEVEIVKRGLADSIAGLVINRTEIIQPKLRFPIPADLAARIQNQTVHSVSRRGKYLLFRLDKGYLLWHLGMSGSIWLHKDSYQLIKHDHVCIHFYGGMLLRYHDPRRFGLLDYCAVPENHRLLNGLGPEPFDDAFSGNYLYDLTRNRLSPVKSIIMNSKLVVGVGNIYACESLFHAGIRPARSGKKLTREECHILVDAIGMVLSKSISVGGSSLRDFVDCHGKPGYFQQELFVYGRVGEKCRICDSELISDRISNRSTVYCPVCQS